MKTRLMFLVMLAAVMTSAIFSHWIVNAESVPRRVEISARRFAYTPSEISLKKGQSVVLVVTSVDVEHGLRFRELNLNAKIIKGAPTELSFTPDKAGDFVGHCSIFCGSGHGGMALTLHVVD